MHGSDSRSGSLFSRVDLAIRMCVDHPMRVVRPFAVDVLAGMSARHEACCRIGADRGHTKPASMTGGYHCGKPARFAPGLTNI